VQKKKGKDRPAAEAAAADRMAAEAQVARAMVFFKLLSSIAIFLLA
jgi:hypothetical protein